MIQLSSLLRKVAINLASNIALPLTAFLTAPILAHGLGVSGRGEVAGATSPLFLLAIAGSMGLPEAVTYFWARSQSKLGSYLGTALWLTFLSGVALTVGVAMLRGVIARGHVELQLMIFVSILALVPTLLIGVVRGAAIGLQNFRFVFWERYISYGLRLLALVALWVSDALTSLNAVFAMAYVPLFGALAYIPMLGLRRPSFKPIEAGLIMYGLRMWAGSLSGVVLARLDQLLMVPLSSTTELGLYAAAVSIGELPLVVNASLREVLFAVDSAENSRRRMSQAARLSTAITAIICLALGLLLPFGLPILFGNEFAPAVQVCAILLVAVVVGNPGSIAGTALSAMGRPGLRSTSLALACVVNLAMILLLVPTLGATGAAFATLVGNIVSSVLVILCCRIFGGYSFLSFYGLRVEDLRYVRSLTVGICHRND